MIRNVDYKTFDARHGKIQSRAVTKSRKVLSGVDGGNGTAISGKTKASVRKEIAAVLKLRAQARRARCPNQDFTNVMHNLCADRG